jgi:hypothetical protein
VQVRGLPPDEFVVNSEGDRLKDKVKKVPKVSHAGHLEIMDDHGRDG